MRLFLRLQIPIFLMVVAAYFLLLWPLRNPHPPVTFPDTNLAIRDARVYTAPDADPMDHATVLVRRGLIVAVGKDIAIPQDTNILECPNCTVTAGFWNAHVHFTESKWDYSAFKSSATLNAQLADMLTSRGFTTVADLGSDLRQTLSLRRRIETGDLRAPRFTPPAPACTLPTASRSISPICRSSSAGRCLSPIPPSPPPKARSATSSAEPIC